MIVCSADLSGSVLCWRRDGSLPLVSNCSSATRPRATRLLIVPTAQPQISRRFLIGKAAGADEDQRLALRLGQVHQRALHVANLDMPVLAGRRGEDLGGGDLVPFALEAGAAHLAQEQVAKDDEGPGAHIGAGLEPLPRRPRLEQRLLDQIVGEVAAAGQRAAEGAQMRDDRRQLFLEFGIGQRNRLDRRGLCLLVIVQVVSQVVNPTPYAGAAMAAARFDRT